MHILIYLALVLIFIVVATAKFKLHPFFSLIISSIFLGFAANLNGNFIISKITEGFGNTLSSIGIIIAFGTIIGVFLEKSGGTRVLADSILKFIGVKRSALAMNITGFVISIPVFCDSGFVILSALNKALSKKTGIPLIVLAISLSAGLYATHVFIPPTPGPLAAAAALDADIGLVILLGIVVAIPTSLAGFFWAKYIGKEIILEIKDEPIEETEVEYAPGITNAILPILVPIVLIAFKSIAQVPSHPFNEGFFFNFLGFVGHPIVALFIGVILAFNLVRGSKNKQLSWVTSGLKEAGVIILITGAGGAMGNIIRAAGIGDIISSVFSGNQLGIFLPFILAAILKTAQGSSTVAIITTAAIVSPMLEPLGLISPEGKALGVLAIGAGAMTVSHLNDSYFWVVSQFSGMNVQSAIKSQTIASLFQGITGILVISLLRLILL